MGSTHDPPPAVQDLPKAFGFPPLIWYLQAECTRMRLLFSFHFRESAERVSYSTNPWRNAQYLCGNVRRHCASREIHIKKKKILKGVNEKLTLECDLGALQHMYLGSSELLVDFLDETVRFE